MSNDDYAVYVADLKAQRTGAPRTKPHRLPLECYSASDCEFLFTLDARQHTRPFTPGPIAQGIVDSLLWRHQHHGWTLFCYCLMPDHLHFLVALPEMDLRYVNGGKRGWVPYGLLQQVADYKSFTSNKVWNALGGRGALWQHSSYDRAIRYNRSIEPAVKYVLNNPVRKGLTATWEGYPYSQIVDPW